MTSAQFDPATRRRPLRRWPGVVIVTVQWLMWQVLPIVEPEAGAVGAVAVLAGGLLVIVWWLFFSRAPWTERVGALLLMPAALMATRPFLHESVATGGLGFLYVVYGIASLSLAFVIWAVASRRLATRARWATMVAAIVLATAGWTLVRTEGVIASGSQLAWRWSPTAEERLLARGADPTVRPPATAAPGSEPDWPGFRGPARDGVVPGVRIATDWAASPPVELWRRPIGPGWSSFAVDGDLLYTQEQRGDDEIVACYRASTGEPVWRHRDAARFWESNAGAGPRATPTLSGGRVYTFGATGILNALDAADGTRVWSRDVASDAEVEVPYWGFAASPLVVGDIVVIAAAGKLAGYDLATGEPRWFGPAGGNGYSSPHLLTLDGVEQVLLLSGAGATSVDPADGTVLWRHEWPSCIITQPAMTDDGDVLVSALSTVAGLGIRRLAVTNGRAGWTTEERWTSSGLKPYHNDFVLHEGHAFGFDGAILSSIDLTDGHRNWKGGRYGQGQLVLLPDQDLLLVVSERGDLALVAATPDKFTELARFPALAGKTWNHPVVVGDRLLLRNGQEMAAFRLPPAGAATG